MNFLGLSGAIKVGVKRASAQTEDTFVVVGGDDEPRDIVELHVPQGARHTVTIALTEGASIEHSRSGRASAATSRSSSRGSRYAPERSERRPT